MTKTLVGTPDPPDNERLALLQRLVSDMQETLSKIATEVTELQHKDEYRWKPD